MQNSMQIMILPSNLVWLDGIAKLWTFEAEGPKWTNRQYHILSCDYYLNNRTDEQNLDLNYSGWSRQELAT